MKYDRNCDDRISACENGDATDTQPLLNPAESSPSIGDNIDVTGATPPKQVIFWFCVSHFLSAWNSRFFEFGSVLFLASIYPQTLMPVSIYALGRALAAICLSPVIGIWIDNGDRLVVVRASILGQRVTVALSCLVFIVLSFRQNEFSFLDYGLFAITVILAGAEKLCSIMNSISVTRDWAVRMTDGREDSRRDLNALIRRIDLSCKLLAPFLVATINEVSTIAAIWSTIGMTVMSASIEYQFIKKVYDSIPSLHDLKVDLSAENQEDCAPDLESPSSIQLRRSTWERTVALLRHIFPWSSFGIYATHDAFLPSLSYAFLHHTVLSFSGRMIAFLLAKNYGSINVSIARILSTVAELSATWISPRLMERHGIIASGAISISWQTLCLSVGVACFLFGDDSALSGLIGGVILSRIGLWGLDLAVQLTIQEKVESGIRGSFSTAEASLQNLFELLSYITTIIFSRPDQFQWPVLTTMISLYMGFAVYWIYVFRVWKQGS